MEERKDNITVEESKNNFPILKILYRNWILILCITIICTLLGTAFGALTAKPVYTAKSNVMLKVYLETSGTESISNNTSFAKKYLPTIADVVKSPAIINGAKEIGEPDNGISAGAVSVSHSNNSLIFSISYTDVNKDLAISRLDKVIESASTSFRQDKPIAVEAIELVKMQNETSVSVSGGYAKYVVIGLVAGIVFGVMIAILVYLLDNKIKDEKELEEITGVSVLSYLSE